MIRRHLPVRAVRRFARRLGEDRRGATIIEFAIVAPVMCLFMMGAGDLLYGAYVNSILLGSVQKAGRDSSLEANSGVSGNSSTGSSTALDDMVMNRVKEVAPTATYVATRRAFNSFSGIDKPEPYIDMPGGTAGQYDAAYDCYTDMNGNNTYDQSNSGIVGVGGASDIAQYTITVTYPRVFPVAKLLGWGTTATVEAQTLLKNQPYANQNQPTQKCPGS